MILSIGEILADLIGEKNDGALTFRAFCGGAPFNLAVNAKQSGATSRVRRARRERRNRSLRHGGSRKSKP